MKKAFVAGWPISHSLSPHLHDYWLRRYGIDGSYDAIAVAPDQLNAFLSALPAADLIGGNITIPHKQAALKACARVDADARSIGAVNTLWLENGLLCGSNTDSYGFLANLDQTAPQWRSASLALVVGAGGASRAIVHALLSNGLEVRLANRTISRAEALAAEFGPKAKSNSWDTIDSLLPDCGLVVNTTSLGMKGQAPLAIDLDRAGTDTIVTDIVYNPIETPLLEQARHRGLKTVDGLGMLMHQAVPGFERWFGNRPEVDGRLREHLLAHF